MENFGTRVPADPQWWMTITSNIDYMVLCSALNDVLAFIWDQSVDLEVRRPYATTITKIAGTGPDFFLLDVELREEYADWWDFGVFTRAFRDCPLITTSTEAKVAAIEAERLRVLGELHREEEEAELGVIIFPPWRPADAG
jgi:hypothetical protein